MTKDDIIRMALEAGFTDADNGRVWITDGYWDDEIKRFAALVAAAERDECAQLADKEANRMNEPFGYMLADRIRMRGKNAGVEGT